MKHHAPPHSSFPSRRADLMREHVAAVRRTCKARGIRIVRKGTAVRLSGPGVDLIATGLAAVQLADLQPVFESDARK